MIGSDEFDQAIIDSRRASADDPVLTMTEAGVDIDAVNALIMALIPAYVGLGPGQTTAAAFASGVELGVRAARIHDGARRDDPA